MFRAIIHMIRHDGDPACMAFDGKVLPDVDTYLEFTDRPDAPIGTRTVDKVKQQPRPRFYATHLGYEAVPKSILEKAKIIYVAGNPKDVIVSTYFFFSSLKPFAFSGTLEDIAMSYINDKAPYTPFHKHVASFWKHRDRDNILFLTYEDTLMVRT
ncbi:hypothetical protein RvY_00202-2 [Ramazzottius varieornatus]|uniref:Sulfotransferase domain-containing protein n=1 Tax=Ramazzottius varieornatus TaxID=947166 RepID=A0A1D1UCW6_RAMVA|nr:hypothetical protein RvY_00202-2 [Ramazzottius varieornatus]